MKPKLNNEEIIILMEAALRDALERKLFFPSEVVLIIVQNKTMLSKEQRRRFADRAYRYIREHSGYGFSNLWRIFAEIMEDEEI